MKHGRAFILFALCMVGLTGGKKHDDRMNRDTIPFWLRDPNDGLCLGPDGFGACDVNSVWIMASPNPKKKVIKIVKMVGSATDKMCLGSKGSFLSSRKKVGMFKCGSSRTKDVSLANVPNQEDLYLLLQGKSSCLNRGQRRLHNSADMQACNSFTSLNVVESSIHTAGVLITTTDGYCFDGTRFRVCKDNDPKLRWGVGVGFASTEPSRTFFLFFDQEKCAMRKGDSIQAGDCSSKGAGRWGWEDGKLSQGGKHCLGRKINNMAVAVPCSEGYEHVTFTTPNTVPIESHKPRFMYGDRDDFAATGSAHRHVEM